MRPTALVTFLYGIQASMLRSLILPSTRLGKVFVADAFTYAAECRVGLGIVC